MYSIDLYKLWWPNEPEDPEYVGCYADSVDDRVLTDMTYSDGMTTAVCNAHCSDKGALYYATQVLPTALSQFVGVFFFSCLLICMNFRMCWLKY